MNPNLLSGVRHVVEEPSLFTDDMAARLEALRPQAGSGIGRAVLENSIRASGRTRATTATFLLRRSPTAWVQRRNASVSGCRERQTRHATCTSSACTRGCAHTDGIESFWSMLKRGYVGVYDRMSPEHLPRFIREFEGRHNNWNLDTIDQIRAVVQGAEGKRLKYAALIRHPHGAEALDWTYVSVDPFYLLRYVDVEGAIGASTTISGGP